MNGNIGVADVFFEELERIVVKVIVILALQILMLQTSYAGDVETNGLITGTIVETGDKVIINGAVFVLNGTGNTPAIKLGGNANKDVIIRNSLILSNNQTIRDDTGRASVLMIDNSRSNSRVRMRNVKVVARNSDISSVSTANDVCAGVMCADSGAYDSMSSVYVGTMGATRVEAVQGGRPDYRKIEAVR